MALLTLSSRVAVADTVPSTTRRRVHVVTECYPRPAARHHCAFAHRQMVGVQASGWNVEVLVPNGWYPPVVWRWVRPWRAAKVASIPPAWSVDGVPVRDLSYRNPAPSRLMRRPVPQRIADSLTRELGGYVRTGHDVLMVQFALPHGPAVRAAAGALGLPYVVQLRGDDVWVWPHRDRASRDAFTETVRDASMVVGVSRSLLEEARRLADHPLPESAVVPNGIDLERFRPPRSSAERQRCRASAGIADRELVVFCVGDLLLRKGWLELLDALGSLSSERGDVRLIGAAAAPVREFDFLAEAQQRAPNVAVRLEQNVQGERLAELYRAADVFCLPSHWEGLANSLLEAMASGLACITTAVAGHPEVVTTGVDGVLVPAKDVAALRHALACTLEDAAVRDTLGRAARLRAEHVGNSLQAGRRLSVLLDGVRMNAFATDEASIDPYAPRATLPSIA